MSPGNSEFSARLTGSFIDRVEIDQTPLVVDPADCLDQVLSWMSQGRVDQSGDPAKTLQPTSYCLVMAGRQLLGIFTERDVVKAIAQQTELNSLTMADVMTRDVLTISSEDLNHPFDVVALLRKHRIRHLPVLDEQSQQLLGVVTHTSLRQSLRAVDLLRLRRVSEVMSSRVITALPDERVLAIAQLMATHRISCVVIVESSGAQNQPVGIITERDVVKLRAQNLELSDLTAAETMSAPLVCMSPQDNLWQVQQQMQSMGVRRLVVAEQGTLSGTVTQTSIA